MIVADTDVLIDFQRGRDPGAAAVLAALDTGRLATTTITAFELESGAASEKQLGRLQDLLSALVVLPLDRAAAREAARLHRSLKDQGLALATADTLIAGLCLHHRASLLTRNRKHFERVPGLTLAEL
ncbi:MAG: type II toxin-antitoxin system VapC family toxin [Acidobacteria bacterium]|nr:type II toxin-antitoxin system VapC family toxin [Acidobacteriota bacterium]